MRHLTLTRQSFQLDGITGVLRDEEDDQVAVTMERSYGSKPKLPDGEYICVRGPHALRRPDGTLKRFETFEIMGVPGHTGMLFHAGNWHTDSEGCILLGRVCCTSTKGQMVTDSVKTFERFMLSLDGQDTFRLTVLSQPHSTLV